MGEERGQGVGAVVPAALMEAEAGQSRGEARQSADSSDIESADSFIEELTAQVASRPPLYNLLPEPFREAKSCPVSLSLSLCACLFYMRARVPVRLRRHTNTRMRTHTRTHAHTHARAHPHPHTRWGGGGRWGGRGGGELSHTRRGEKTRRISVRCW